MERHEAKKVAKRLLAQAPRSWDERFQAIVAYKSKHGECNVPLRYEKDLGLGHFVSRLRSGGPSGVTTEQRRRLDELGFDWETQQQKNDRLWMETYRFFRESMADPKFFLVLVAKHGNHSGKVTETKKKLSSWINNQKYLQSRGKLRADRENLLNELPGGRRGMILQQSDRLPQKKLSDGWSYMQS